MNQSKQVVFILNAEEAVWTYSILILVAEIINFTRITSHGARCLSFSDRNISKRIYSYVYLRIVWNSEGTSTDLQERWRILYFCSDFAVGLFTEPFSTLFNCRDSGVQCSYTPPWINHSLLSSPFSQ